MELPVEILHMIFNEVETFDDVLWLCLVHERLGAVGERYINRSILDLVAPWAGERIVCLGEETTDDDFPPQLQSDVAAWKDAAAKSNYESVAPFLENTLGDPACGGLQGLQSFLVRYLSKTLRTGFSEADHDKIEQLVECFHTFCDTERYRIIGGDGVLCNLSRGEYINMRAVTAFNERLPTEDAHWYLGPCDVEISHVLLSKICWSSYPTSSTDAEAGRLDRGPWAGDRFEITTMDRMREGFSWKDVTEESFELIKDLWEAYFIW